MPTNKSADKATSSVASGANRYVAFVTFTVGGHTTHAQYDVHAAELDAMLFGTGNGNVRSEMISLYDSADPRIVHSVPRSLVRLVRLVPHGMVPRAVPVPAPVLVPAALISLQTATDAPVPVKPEQLPLLPVGAPVLPAPPPRRQPTSALYVSTEQLSKILADAPTEPPARSRTPASTILPKPVHVPKPRMQYRTSSEVRNRIRGEMNPNYHTLYEGIVSALKEAWVREPTRTNFELRWFISTLGADKRMAAIIHDMIANGDEGKLPKRRRVLVANALRMADDLELIAHVSPGHYMSVGAAEKFLDAHPGRVFWGVSGHKQEPLIALLASVDGPMTPEEINTKLVGHVSERGQEWKDNPMYAAELCNRLTRRRLICTADVADGTPDILRYEGLHPQPAYIDFDTAMKRYKQA